MVSCRLNEDGALQGWKGSMAYVMSTASYAVGLGVCAGHDSGSPKKSMSAWRLNRQALPILRAGTDPSAANFLSVTSWTRR